MTQLIVSLAALALGLAIGGCASQRSHSDPMETPMAPASGPAVPTADTPNTQDRMFVDQAALGGAAEVEFGRLAEQRGASAQVRQFGQRMVADHGQSNARLTALAEENGIALPNGLDDEHRAALARLEAMSGHEFDVAYMRRQVGDHQKTVQLLAWEINSGQDAEIKGFAAETLPVVMGHLDSAKRILSGLTGQAALPIARSLSPTTGRDLRSKS